MKKTNLTTGDNHGITENVYMVSVQMPRKEMVVIEKRLVFIMACVLAFSAYFNYVKPEGSYAAAFPSILSPVGEKTEKRMEAVYSQTNAAMEQSTSELPGTLIAGGDIFGVRFFTEGVLVVSLVDIQTANGSENPAFSAGIRVRDIILKVDGVPVESNENLLTTVSNSGGKSLNVIIRRGNSDFEVSVVPVISTSDGTYKIGAMVRDSTAGIGTITYYDSASGTFGALGHGICDPDTAELFLLRNATAFGAHAYTVIKGEKGSPGEIRGIFDLSGTVGVLSANTDYGVFGIANEAIAGKEYPVAPATEVKTGYAQIICTLDETGPQYYDIEITKLIKPYSDNPKNMAIRITDPKLLEKTNGIVQGMSGSPIIQNEKIVGAVTHVFINDPASGYGVFIENMLKAAREVPEKNENAA